MYNPQIIADRQRDIRVAEGMFGDYPGGKWHNKSPESTSFGDPSIVVQGSVQRGRRDVDGNPSTRYAGFVGGGGSRMARYAGFGRFHRFGVFGDDSFDPSSIDLSVIQNPSLGETPLTDDLTSSGDMVVAPAQDTGPSWWDRLTGVATAAGSAAGAFVNSAQGQRAVQQAGGGGLLSLFGIGGAARPNVPAQPQKSSATPWVVGGAAVLLGYLLLKKG